ncbi:pyridoxal-phosphate dependent enzyme [Candidatus Nephthysia bennettiae]|uniref:Pyridoxal-phosphate dependent enzyme n=1 Tax=Candidatus Nephthysia bennettiae TaxID=3127016 RepID=A0A934N2L2_9BACT|nr:pyridoxal-phosphate dependent enzyme [Candidatus Dormibacteraeota bacterium]MBJ7613528.1 pyridoxal-phosphate dependent enzyme [Candidatus Dormibacteraeota bacterium]
MAGLRVRPSESTGAAMEGVPSAADLASAREFLAREVPPTPAVSLPHLSSALGREIWMKLECLSPIRSFKHRGALCSVRALKASGASGVLTVSTGNHGQGVAYAGGRLGVPVTVVAPRPSEPRKLAAMRALGAQVELRGENLSEAEEAAAQLAAARELVYLEDGEDPWLMAGASTVLLELTEQAAGLDTVLVQVGGGNLVAASLLAARAAGSPVRIVGVQSTAAPGATLSWQQGSIRPAESRTIAGGIATEKPGRLSLEVMKALLGSMVLVDDADLWRSVGTLLQTTGLAVEPSGAAGLAALERFGAEIEGERVGVLLTGGWIGEAALAQVAARLAATSVRRESV